jgi:hypothetical protein
MLRYLRPLLGFLPFLPPLVLVYLAYKVPGFKYVLWAIGAVILACWVAAYINTKRIFRNISEGQLPEVLATFPIHATSEEEYRAARQKMETFIRTVEANQPAEVTLTTAEINSLHLKGKTPNKVSNLLLPEYYEIADGRIYEYTITPAPFISWVGFWQGKSELSFLREGDRLIESDRRVSDNGKAISPERQSSFYKKFPEPKLLPAILRLDKTMEWAERMERILGRLKVVEIVTDRLILRFSEEPDTELT